VSPVFDSGSTNMTGLVADWDAQVPAGSSMNVYVRSSPNSDMSSSTGMSKLEDGVLFSPGVVNQYIQYKVEMSSANGSTTPLLKKMTIILNRVPTLDQGGHSPETGGPMTYFIFSVVYTDPDSTTPTATSIFIDGSRKTMSSTGIGTISQGMRYEYKSYLGVGTHTYYFQFNDSFGGVRYPMSTLLSLTVMDAPSLNSAEVFPLTGDTNTLFKFSVRYSDSSGSAAYDSTITLDEIMKYSMATNGDGSAGYYIYTYETKLSAGTHNFAFDFSNGVTHARLPDKNSYSGPEVKAPAFPLEITQITPHDSSTGIPLTASVSVIFNKPILEYTIEKTNFILKDSNGTTIAGSYLYKPSTYEAVFTPSASLEYDTLYSVTITQGVLDSNWSSLTSVYQSTFRTLKKNAPPPNRAPVVTPVMSLDGTAGKYVSIKLNATDPDGDTLAFKIISGPAGATVNPYGFFSWASKKKDVGNHAYVIEVTDGEFKAYIMLSVNLKKAPSNTGNQNMAMIGIAVGVVIAVVVSLLVVILIMRSKKKDTQVQPVTGTTYSSTQPTARHPEPVATQSVYDSVPIRYAEDRGPGYQQTGPAAGPQGIKQDEFYSTWEKPARPGLDKEYAFKAPVSTALASKPMTKAQMDATKASTQKSSDSKKVTIDGTAYTRVDILKLISSLPRGLPSELWGKDLDDLADEILNGEYSKASDGGPIVKLGRKWFSADPKDMGTYMRPYKGLKSE
jgi:hypothetical protein